jgi:ADP-dependent NAD(P)H-hydrate dehydratase / NAD(P)H-hydrate epimerase
MREPDSVALLDAAGARAGDEAAVRAGDSWAALMERAAGHLARGIVAAGGHGYGLKVAIVVGKGNNGGDGWAAARRLREHGAVAWVVAPDGIDVEVSDEAAAHREGWLATGGRTSEGLDDLQAALAWADVGVDALLGTGTRGAPRGPAADAVAAFRRAHGAGTIVVACDTPSGG